MSMATVSLRDHTAAQLSALCQAVGFPESNNEPIRLLHELLGPVGARPLSQPPAWNSDIADDRTPAEFSVAFDDDGSTTVRVLIEPVAAQPGHRANMELSTRLVHSLSERFGFSLDQFHAISELFLSAEPRGSSRSGVRLCCGRSAHRISISGYRLVEIPTLLRPFNCRLVPLAVE